MRKVYIVIDKHVNGLSSAYVTTDSEQANKFATDHEGDSDWTVEVHEVDHIGFYDFWVESKQIR